jgi:UDP-N-acetyl-D-glucosamine dehydrogenase
MMDHVRKAAAGVGKVGIIGLGFVGLPLAMVFMNKGYSVIGIELNADKLIALREGRSYIQDISSEELLRVISSGQLAVTNDYSAASDAAAIIICVPTPLSQDRTPDLSYLIDSCNRLASELQPDQLIVIESSTYPGTTTEVVQPLLEQRGGRAGVDFYLTYSPERIDPGNGSMELSQIAKVVSGVTKQCLKQICGLYETVFEKVVTVSSTEAAETMKLLENTYRFINISFINEFAQLCDKLGVNAWEIIHAAATKPYGFSPFYPGPGIGGHCIPVDPHYLQWKAIQEGLPSRFIDVSQRINSQIPDYIAERIQEHLPRGKKLNTARILLYGVTYKKDIADARESTAMKIIEMLQKHGANVHYHDPYIAKIQLDDKSWLHSVDLTKEELQLADCLVILTDHSELPVRLIAEHCDFVFDTRNVMTSLRPGAKLITLGDGRRNLR